MKTAIVSFYTSFPPVCGAASVTYHFAKNTPGEKILIQFENRPRSEYAVGDLTIWPIFVRDRNHVEKTIHVLLRIPTIVRKLKRLAPQFIIIEGSSWAIYYLLLFWRFRFERGKSFVVYHVHNVESSLRAQTNGRFIAAVTKWAERKLFQGVDLTAAVSSHDADIFENFYGVRPILLANGIDLGEFRKIPPDRIDEIRRKYGLQGHIGLFMGLVNYPPNREALDFLIGEVFPRIVRNVPQARLVVIGGTLKVTRPWLINPGVIPFEEIPAFLQACDICLAPIFSGSGTRLKILEYMAAGKPVIATTKGAEGLDVRPGRDLLIADQAGDFVSGILDLFHDEAQASRLGENGRALVERIYDWPALTKEFFALAEQARVRKAPTASLQDRRTK